MKKIYTLVLCSAVCLSAAADGQRFKTIRGQHKAKAFRTESATPIWRPSSQTDFMHDGEDWMKLGEVKFKYDVRGNCTEELVDEDGWLSKATSTYDEYNYPLSILLTESEDGETWEESGKMTYEYDPVVHGFHTLRMGYTMEDGEWVMDYRCESNTITRNNDGNITEICKSLPLGGELQPALKSVWKYGPDGKANEYGYYVIGEDGTWGLYDDLSYGDITWEATDGQMTIFGDISELTRGLNLLSSAVVYYDGEADGHIFVEYPRGGDRGGFFIRETTNDVNEVGRTVLYEVFDANGSERITETEYFDEEGNILTEPVYILIAENIRDEHGNVVKTEEKETIDGVEEVVASTKYTYSYDNNGNVTESTTEEYDYETESYFPTERVVYGDYINAADNSGLETTVAKASWSYDGENVTASAEGLTGLTIYSLQGVELAHAQADSSVASVNISALAPGVYIVRAEGTGSVYRVVRR